MATIEQEQAAFDSIRYQLMNEGHRGEYVLFKGTVRGFFHSLTDAMATGAAMFPSDVYVIDVVGPRVIPFWGGFGTRY